MHPVLKNTDQISLHYSCYILVLRAGLRSQFCMIYSHAHTYLYEQFREVQ